MGSLSAHLRAPEDHARLPFHPDCPVCRSERLDRGPAAGGRGFAADASGPRRGRARASRRRRRPRRSPRSPTRSSRVPRRPASRAAPTPRTAPTSTPAALPPTCHRTLRRCRSSRRRPPPATTMPRRSTKSRPTTSTLRWPTRATSPPDRTRSNPPRPRLRLPRPPPATRAASAAHESGPDRGRASGSDRCAGLAAHERQFATPGARAPSGHEAGGEEASSPEPVSGRAPLPPMPPPTPRRARRARPPAFNRSQHGRRPASPWRSGIATLPRAATARTSLAPESRCGRSPGTCSAARRRPPRSRARSTGCGSSTRTASAPAIPTC